MEDARAAGERALGDEGEEGEKGVKEDRRRERRRKGSDSVVGTWVRKNNREERYEGEN